MPSSSGPKAKRRSRSKIALAFFLLFALCLSGIGTIQGAGWHTIQTDSYGLNITYPTAVWDGGGADALASTAANWVGNVAPLSDSIVIFNSTSTKSCTWDITTTMHSINLNSGYTGTVTQSVNIKCQYLNVTAGTFTAINTKTIDIYQKLRISGGTWTSSKGLIVLHNATIEASSFSTYILYFANMGGGTVGCSFSVSNSVQFMGLTTNTQYWALRDGIKLKRVNTTTVTMLTLYNSGTYAAGKYKLQYYTQEAWHTIQEDSYEHQFQEAGWHTIQEDSYELQFDPWAWHTIQEDSTEQKIGTLTNIQTMQGYLSGTTGADYLPSGSSIKTNMLGIIWLLVFFLPAIILFIYLGKIGGALGIIMMSIISAFTFPMGYFILALGVGCGVMIMLSEPGGNGGG